jgi:hypothetical protein
VRERNEVFLAALARYEDGRGSAEHQVVRPLLGNASCGEVGVVASELRRETEVAVTAANTELQQAKAAMATAVR